MGKLTILSIISLALVLTGCSSVPLSEVAVDELKVDVRLQQDHQQTRLDVKMRRGVWDQPVNAERDSLLAMTESGDVVPLQPANKRGQYGFIEKPTVYLNELKLGALTSVEIPPLAEVRLTGKDTFIGQLFFRDDVLTLQLPASQGDDRYLVATGLCGSAEYRSELKISNATHRLEIRLSSVMSRINAVAEADLAGIIPVELAIEERYYPSWPAPFTKVELLARDSADIQIDTSGFRFKADVRVQLGNAFLSLQNQPWPTRYCL